MSRAVVAFSIGMDPAPCVLDSLRHAAERWGAALRILREPIEAGHPHAQRLRLPEWACDHGYAEYVSVDLDLMIRSDCPCPLDMLGGSDLGYVALESMAHLSVDYVRAAAGYFRQWCRDPRIPLPAEVVAINAGLQAVRVTEEVRRVYGYAARMSGWIGPERFARLGTDQVALDLALAHYETEYATLPAGMNFIVAPARDWVDSALESEVVSPGPMRYHVQHLAGCRRTYSQKERIMSGWEWR